MLILVITDKEIDQESAIYTLPDQDVMIARSFQEAMRIMSFKGMRLDVVLSDVIIPMTDSFDCREDQCFSIATHASSCDAKFVGIVTDPSYKRSIISEMLGDVGMPGYGLYFFVNCTRVMYIRSLLTSNGAKNWGQVLADLTTDSPAVEQPRPHGSHGWVIRQIYDEQY